MSSRPAAVLLLALALAAGGCSAPRPQRSPVVQAAEAASRKGIEAESAGNPATARAAFEQALKDYASIEATPEVAQSLVNLARIERRQGELEAATATLDRALHLPLADPALESEVAFEKALLLLARRQEAEALDWARRALAAAPAASRGRDRNLVARILLRQGDYRLARQEGRKALDELDPEQYAERGNAHRVLAGAALASRDGAAAAGEFETALALDKQAGLCLRIAADLRGLAHCALLRQDSATARDYLQRAFAVASAGDRFDLARELLDELVGNFRAAGDEASAQRLEAERRRLADLAGRTSH